MNTKIKAALRNFLPSRVKRHRIWSGPLRGRSMVTSWRHNFTSIVGRTEPDVIAWFARMAQPGEIWLDIGANYGYTAMCLADRVGPSGRVFAFEPKLETCGCLAESVHANGLNQVVVVPAGLGRCETIEMKRFEVSGSMAVGAGETAGSASETLMVACLDWFWPQIAGGDHKIHGVKIDVQGMELDVLHGMVSLLAAYTPKLIVEVHAGVDRNELLDLLERCGYERQGSPVFEGVTAGETGYRDNMSYAFAPRSADTRPRGAVVLEADMAFSKRA